MRWSRGSRAIGVYKSQAFALTVALWWLYITFNWEQSPYTSGRQLKIFVVVD